MTRYSTHPMETKFTQWDLEEKAKRNRYWARLRTAFSDYLDIWPEATFKDFTGWMERQYGLEVNMVGGNIGTTYKIVDETKYTMFVLKYGSN